MSDVSISSDPTLAIYETFAKRIYDATAWLPPYHSEPAMHFLPLGGMRQNVLHLRDVWAQYAVEAMFNDSGIERRKQYLGNLLRACVEQALDSPSGYERLIGQHVNNSDMRAVFLDLCKYFHDVDKAASE